MTRWKAAGIHLLISAAVVGALGGLMLSTWYARGLFQFAHADRLLLLVGGIDVIAGPLLTLLIYRVGKKGLKLDLGLIALAQIAFLGYGLSVVWASRPVFLVALPQRIQLVFAHEIGADALPVSEGPLPRSRLPWLGPELVGARRPDDIDAQQQLIDQMLAGRDLPVFPRYYLPYEQVSGDLLAASDGIEALGHRLPERQRAALHQELERAFTADGRWVPIASSRGTAAMFLDPRSGKPIRVYPIDPR